MRKNRLLALALAAIATTATWAQEDVTSTYIDNADFSQGTVITKGVTTYAYDIYDATNNTKGKDANGSGLQTGVTGWTPNYEGSTYYIQKEGTEVPGNGCSGGIYTYGGTAWLGAPANVVPSADTDEEGIASGNALGITNVWTHKGFYSQTAKSALSAGSYKMTIRMYCKPSGNNTAIAENLFGYVESDGTTHYGSTTSFSTSGWITETITFTLSNADQGTFSLGYEAANAGIANVPKFFIDNVTLESILANKEELLALITEAEAKAEGASIGDQLFQVSEEDKTNLEKQISNARAVYNNSKATQDQVDAACETLENALDAFQSAVNLPDPETPYSIQQKSSKLYLNLEGEKAAISETNTPFYFTEGEDGWYYITDGTNYFGLSTANKWDTSTNTDTKSKITVEPKTLDEGLYYYILTKTTDNTKQCLGSDNTAAGSALYSDKTREQDNSYWIITEMAGDGLTLDETETTAISDEYTDTDVTLKRTLVAGWNTIVLPFDVDASTAESVFGNGYEVATFSNDVQLKDEIVLNYTSASAITANTPSLLYLKAEVQNPKFEGVDVKPTTDLTVSGTYYDFVGTYVYLTDNSPIVSGDYIVNNAGIALANGGNKLKAFRAYLKKKSGAGARSVKFAIDGTTAIGSIETEAAAPLYNLKGQRVIAPQQKGIYISDGHKKLIK